MLSDSLHSMLVTVTEIADAPNPLDEMQATNNTKIRRQTLPVLSLGALMSASSSSTKLQVSASSRSQLSTSCYSIVSSSISTVSVSSISSPLSASKHCSVVSMLECGALSTFTESTPYTAGRCELKYYTVDEIASNREYFSAVDTRE